MVKEVKKGPWTREEDQKLLDYIKEHGHGSWASLPAKAGLERWGKSCRLRWTNYLRPDIKRGKLSTHEEKTIIRLHALLGNRWSAIAAHLPKRTDNEIKNYWNTRLKKRLARMGIDPTTHKPKNSDSAQSQHSAILSHMAQWEAARLEAEARLARTSRPDLFRRFAFRPSPSPLPPLHTAMPPPLLPPLPLRHAALPPPPCLDVLKVWRATAGAINSPTSTLNFSNDSCMVPKVPNVSTHTKMYHGACGMEKLTGGNIEVEGKTDILSGLGHVNPVYGTECDAVDLDTLDYDLGVGAHSRDSVREFDDVGNYWNDILNLVSSPMEFPGFFDL